MEQTKASVLIMIATQRDIDMLDNLISRARSALQKFDWKFRYVLSVNEKDADGTNSIQSQAKDFAQKHVDIEVFVAPGLSHGVVDAGAGRYINGLDYCSQNSEYVIEMDGGGAHNPDELGVLVEPLVKGYQTVLSSRFGTGGVNKYPLQRRMSSFLTTLYANAFLGLGMYVSDMASGFEAFRSDVLKQVFEVRPATKWITLRTTTALIQTELRSYILWLYKYGKLKVLNNERGLMIVGISYGLEKEGKAFPTNVMISALKGLVFLFLERFKFARDIKNAKAN